MALEEYKRKRKFNKTPEPIGELKKEENRLRFVVQKHEASHLHYDLRLELNGVLKSWAIPKGPSLNPHDKRLAILVEDHPVDYLTFEGTIPEGNYGAGNVMVWDIGTISAKGKDIVEDEKILNEGFQKGHLTFILYGEKLKGEFALAKIKKSPENWLLIKKGDEFATENNILNQNVSALSKKTMLQISQTKEKSGLEDLPETKMPKNIKPMLATLIKKPFDDINWIYEIKWDGYRAIAEIENKKVNLYSRNNISFNDRYEEIVNSLRNLEGKMILDGEVVALNDQGKPDFQLLQNYKDSKKGILVYYIYDLLYLNGKNLMNLELIKRKTILRNILSEKIPFIEYNDHVEKEGTAFFEAATKQNLEGIMAKKKTSIYQPGKRTDDWLKIKSYLSQEVIICGYTEPKGSRRNFGALILGIYKDNKLTYVGHTGTGFSDQKLEEIIKILEPLKIEKPPFSKSPKTNNPVTWVKPLIVGEIKFAEWTKEGLMRQPVFLRIREDKIANEVSLEDKSSVNEIKPLRIYRENKKEIEINSRKLKLTNLNKVFWPEEKIAKGDLINYYQEISEYILPYLIDRPQSLHRYPDGIYGEEFYQKNMRGGIPSWIETIKIHSKHEEKDVRYFLCQNKESLIFLANFGCIDLNPWSSRVKKLDYPDYILIDLDPVEIDFDFVIESALSVKETMDEIGIDGYCKTSGATGIHIFIPTGGKYTYDQVKDFAKLLATLVNKKLPDITSIERFTEKRRGKVYLDFLQNIKGQTIASVYSVRPFPHATVSTPLKWEELKKGVKPTDFTIKNVPARLKEIGDIFKPVLEKGIDMNRALQKLENLL